MSMIRAAIDAHYDRKREEISTAIVTGHLPGRPAPGNDPDWYLAHYSTNARRAAYKEGRLSRESAVKLATARAMKELDKEHAKYHACISTAVVAETVQSITIVIKWTRSACWGFNPKATVTTFNAAGNIIGEYTGKASGYGYDKKSAAIAEALNKSPEVMALVYAAENLRLQNDPQPTRRDAIGYGLGTWILPEWEGGVGFSAQAAIFDRLGFKVETLYSDNTFDNIMIRRK